MTSCLGLFHTLLFGKLHISAYIPLPLDPSLINWWLPKKSCKKGAGAAPYSNLLNTFKSSNNKHQNSWRKWENIIHIFFGGHNYTYNWQDVFVCWPHTIGKKKVPIKLVEETSYYCKFYKLWTTPCLSFRFYDNCYQEHNRVGIIYIYNLIQHIYLHCDRLHMDSHSHILTHYLSLGQSIKGKKKQASERAQSL